MADVLKEVSASCNAPDPGHAVTLPAVAYTSGELYELERDKLFLAGWLPVCRADQLADPGSYYSIDVLGRMLVVTRDRAGELHVLSRICRHRWMEVSTGSGRANSLQCPYHLWTYGLDGKLLGAPEMHDVPDFHREDFCLPRVRHEVWHGFVFVNLDGTAAPLGPRLATLEPYLAAYEIDGYRTVKTTDWGVVEWDWKIMVENFMECYHHMGPHRTTLEDEYPSAAAWTDRGDLAFSVMHIPQDRKYEPRGPFLKPGAPGLDEDQQREVLIFTVWPHFMVSLGPGFLYWMKVLPEGPGRIGLQLDICMSGAALAGADRAQLEKELVDAVVAVHAEDLDICAGVQRAANSGLEGVGRLSLLEQPLWEFYRYIGRELGLVTTEG